MNRITVEPSEPEITEKRLAVLREIANGTSSAPHNRLDIACLLELVDRLALNAAEAKDERDRAEALAVRNARALAEAQVENRQLRKALAPFGALADIFDHKAGLRPTAGEIKSWSDHRVGDRSLTVEHLQEARRALDNAAPKAEPIEARYTNYKGETAIRRFLPYKVYLGANEWHPQQQVLIDAVDCEKNGIR